MGPLPIALSTADAYLIAKGLIERTGGRFRSSPFPTLARAFNGRQRAPVPALRGAIIMAMTAGTWITAGAAFASRNATVALQVEC